MVVSHGRGLSDRGVDTVGCLAVGVDYGMGTRYAYGCWVGGRLRPLLRHLVRHGWWGLAVTAHVLRLGRKGGRHTWAGVNGASRIKNSILRLSIHEIGCWIMMYKNLIRIRGLLLLLL